MSQKVASLYATIGADTSGFEKGAKNVKRELAGIAPGVESAVTKLRNFAQANAALLSVLTVAAYATGKALKYSIEQAAQAELVDAKLAAVLASTAGAAGMTSNELNKMATALSHLSVYDDEAIKGSEALLLTFTKVGKEVFPEAQQAILNMSSALGQDLQSSTIQLGKALNDPIAGITALKRVGVSFTEEQREMIKVMVASGDTLGAQKLILHELTVEFGGQALAASKTYSGQTKQLKNEIDNLAEAIGTGLLPELTDSITEIKDFTIAVNDNWEEIKVWGYWITRIANPALFLRDAIEYSKDEMEKYSQSLIDNGHAIHGLGGKHRDLADGTIAAAEAADEATAANKAQADGINNELIPSLYDLESDLVAVEKAEKELSDTIGDQIGLINNIQSAEENYTKDSKKLAEQRGEAEIRLADLRSQGYSEQSEQVQDALQDIRDITTAEADLEKERERQMLEFISGILAQKLARDGWTQAEFDAFADQQVAWGLWSEDARAKAAVVWAEADRVTASINAIPSEKTTTINLITNETTFKRFMEFTGGSPGRAAGGPVMAGSSYMVGEQGPELFVPNSSGNIIPNGKSGGNGGNVFNITVTADFADPETIARRLKPAVTRVMREAGVV